jgi:XTP/dITP diphosphohydrolase
MRIILASNNNKKLKELQQLLASPALEWTTQAKLGIAECAEPHATFVENALEKARHASKQGGAAAIADDSGLCVRALGGLPGVRSARLAQDAGLIRAGQPRDAIDTANNQHLLHLMKDQPDRHAHFMCVLVALRHPEDPEPLVAQGHWAGQLLHAPQGKAGFGYDPLLYIASEQASAAALAPARKNALSHRAQACQTMRELMSARWGLA